MTRSSTGAVRDTSAGWRRLHCCQRNSRAICPARVASQYSRISPPKPCHRSPRPSSAMQLSWSASSAGLKTQVASTWRIPSSRYPELVFPGSNISCSKMASRIGVSTVGSVIHQFAVGCRPGRACCGCTTVGGILPHGERVFPSLFASSLSHANEYQTVSASRKSSPFHVFLNSINATNRLARNRNPQNVKPGLQRARAMACRPHARGQIRNLY